MARFFTAADGRALAFAGLIALHFVASAFAVQSVVDLIALRELFVAFPIVVGLCWGQAILLGQFLVLGTTWLLVRIGVTASWFALVIYLAQPFFRSVIIPAMGSNPLPAILLTVLAYSALLAVARRLGGVRIGFGTDAPREGNALRFSLRQIFLLTLLAAAAMGSVRLGRDVVEEESQALVLGFLPGLYILAVLPGFSLWAALGGGHPVLRSAALAVFGLASIVGPLFIGRAQPQTYWKLGWPVAMASLVVIPSLLIVRAIGWRCCVKR